VIVLNQGKAVAAEVEAAEEEVVAGEEVEDVAVIKKQHYCHFTRGLGRECMKPLATYKTIILYK
jgi:hypothetical protein